MYKISHSACNQDSAEIACPIFMFFTQTSGITTFAGSAGSIYKRKNKWYLDGVECVKPEDSIQWMVLKKAYRFRFKMLTDGIMVDLKYSASQQEKEHLFTKK